MRSVPAWVVRPAAVLVFLAVYLFVWQPVRTWLTQSVAFPVATFTNTSNRYFLDAARHARTLYVDSADDPGGEAVAAFHAPAGRVFLVAALVLIGFFPRRPYWLYLWGAHLGLGALSFGALLAGLGGVDAGFSILAFLDRYVTMAVSMAAMLVVWPVFRRRIAHAGE